MTQYSWVMGFWCKRQHSVLTFKKRQVNINRKMYHKRECTTLAAHRRYRETGNICHICDAPLYKNFLFRRSALKSTTRSSVPVSFTPVLITHSIQFFFNSRKCMDRWLCEEFISTKL